MNDTTQPAAQAANKVCDITDLDVTSAAEEGIALNIINPRTREPTGNWVKVLGVFAPRFRELLQQAKKRSELARRNPVASAVRVTTDDEDVAELLSEVTVDWSLQEVGKQLPFSRAEAKRVYNKYPIIRQQVFDGALDVANFVKG